MKTLAVLLRRLADRLDPPIGPGPVMGVYPPEVVREIGRRHLAEESDNLPAILSPGRSTTLRPGETPAQAMNRLTEGRDL